MRRSRAATALRSRARCWSWANCISGKGAGASVWNNSLAFDLNTGEQYEISDLFVSGYMDTVKSLLPDEHAIYLYSFPA